MTESNSTDFGFHAQWLTQRLRPVARCPEHCTRHAVEAPTFRRDKTRRRALRRPVALGRSSDIGVVLSIGVNPMQ